MFSRMSCSKTNKPILIVNHSFFRISTNSKNMYYQIIINILYFMLPNLTNRYVYHYYLSTLY